MVQCSFCGNELAKGVGFAFFKKDGTALHYCSRKCQRNAQMGRKPKNFKWTTKA